MQTSQAQEHLDADAEERMAPGSGLLIGVLVVATFVMILNETIMSVALPRLMVDLDISASTAQWLTTGFLLTMAVVIPTTGYLFQRFPLRPMFMASMGVFSLGTLFAASAPGFGLLLAGRVTQAVGTAIMLPLLMTTVLRVVPAARRGRMMGIISIVIAVAPAIGPTISGIVLDAFDWRWMFWIVLPISLVAFVVGSVLVKNVTTTGKAPLDVISVVLSALAFGGIVYGLSSIGHAAEDSQVPAWVPLAVGVVALAVFVVRQLSRQSDGRALLDLRPFSTPAFSLGLGMLVISMMALFGALILLPLYLQNVRGINILTTGLLLLPGGLVMGVLSPFVGRIYDRTGPRVLVISGAAVVAAALWLMAMLDAESALPMVVLIHSLLMGGLASVMTPLMTSSLGSLPDELYSHGSAIFSTIQQLAGAAGTALFVTVMTYTATDRLADGATEVDAAQAGIHTAFLYGGIVSLLALAVSFFIGRPERTPVTEAHPVSPSSTVAD